MSTVAAASCDSKGAGEARGDKKPLKPCCACPETKKARDAWYQRMTFLTEAQNLAVAFVAAFVITGLVTIIGPVKKREMHPQNGAPFIIEKGEENCGHLIEAHKECMRALGFKI